MAAHPLHPGTPEDLIFQGAPQFRPAAGLPQLSVRIEMARRQCAHEAPRASRVSEVLGRSGEPGG